VGKLSRAVFVTLTLVIMLGLGWVTRAFASPWRRAVMQKRLETADRVDLAGLATIELPPSFTPVGRGQDGARPGHFDPATLDRHRNAYQITFRFEQGQHTVLGGYLANPVLLHVTLFNPSQAKPDASKIGFTTIRTFYPPVDDRARLEAHFAAQRWLDDRVVGDAVTRAAATNEGRGDNVSSGPPERWLVIHVDPTRRIRVDLYAWRKAYSLDEARALVRRIAESVQTTPKLAAMFDAVPGAEAREDARFEKTVNDALAALGQCGIRSIGPGMTASSGRCASWLSDDRRFLRLARTMGRIPLASFPAAGTTRPRSGSRCRLAARRRSSVRRTSAWHSCSGTSRGVAGRSADSTTTSSTTTRSTRSSSGPSSSACATARASTSSHWRRTISSSGRTVWPSAPSSARPTASTRRCATGRS
jgi:hypothetical protein